MGKFSKSQAVACGNKNLKQKDAPLIVFQINFKNT